MDEIEQIITKMNAAIARGDQTMAIAKMHPLSDGAELGPYLFFLMGETIQEISDKTGLPKEILALSARKHNWAERREKFTGNGRTVPQEMQRQMANSLLVATFMAVSEEVKGVMSGEIHPSQAKFIPKNLNGLQTLVQMVTAISSAEEPKKGSTVIKAENIQMNFSGEAPKSKKDLLQELAESIEIVERKEL